MLGEQIKKVRESAKESQTELAQFLSISKQAVSSYENGSAQPTIDTLCRIARHYGCSADYLLELDSGRCYIETAGLTEEQRQQLIRLAKEFEKLNRMTKNS